jgi:hypothetical protein
MDRVHVQALQRLASGQHGLFTSKQAEDLVVSRFALREAVDRAWIRRVRRGVYAFNGRPPSRWEAILAASLSIGPAAVISHAAAAAVHGFWGMAESRPELTIIRPGGRNLEGARIHRSTTIRPQDVVRRCGVQVTSPVRTLIDVVPSTNDYLLPRIVDEGAIARLWTAEDVGRRLDAADHHVPGAPRLRRVLAERFDEGHPDSKLEQRVYRLLKGRVPPFSVHHRIDLGGRVVELDMAWPAYRVAGEIDGRRIRLTSRTKFEADRLRSNLLERYGWREIHLTAAMDDVTMLAQVVPLFSGTSGMGG